MSILCQEKSAMNIKIRKIFKLEGSFGSAFLLSALLFTAIH